MGKELFALQQMQVQEQSDINQDLKDMKCWCEQPINNMRSRDAQEASAAAMQQGVASVGSSCSRFSRQRSSFVFRKCQLWIDRAN